MLYTVTLAPGVLPADAGEFQLVAVRLGVAHPPGYPLYTLIAHSFTWLMPGRPFGAVNFFSALSAALTVSLAGKAARGISGSLAGGLIASAALAAVPSFWVTATQASIRPLTAFFLALALERALAFGRGKRQPALNATAAALSLGLTHHPSMLFAGVLVGGYMLLHVGRPGQVIKAAPWALLGLIPWLYLPIRGAMGALLAPDDLATSGGFWRHALALGFSGDAFAFNPLSRLGVLGNILVIQFGVILLLMLPATASLFYFKRGEAALLLGGAALHSLLTLSYRAPQTVEYMVPAYLLLAVTLGAGLGVLRLVEGSTRRWLHPLLMVAALAGLAWHGITNGQDLIALSRDDSTQASAAAILDQAPEGAAVLASWHWYTPLLALQQVEGCRPDLEIIYVYPEGAQPLAQTWAVQAQQAAERSPAIVTSYYPTEYAATGLTFTPLAVGSLPVGAWSVTPGPLDGLPADFQPLEVHFGQGVSLVGFSAPQQASMGQVLRIRLAWRLAAEAPPEVYGYAHLTTAEGTVLTADDRLIRPGGITITEHTLAVPSGVEAGCCGLMIGARAGAEALLTPEGGLRAALPSLLIAEGRGASEGQGVHFGGEMILISAEAAPTEALQPGDQVTVRLNWLALRPIMQDYVVKVDLIGPGYAWRAQSDHVPAEGALPTLKWLPGWQIMDVHRLRVPLEAAPGPVHIEVVVYDHFTNAPLPPLDPTLNQQGRAIRIWQGVVE